MYCGIVLFASIYRVSYSSYSVHFNIFILVYHVSCLCLFTEFSSLVACIRTGKPRKGKNTCLHVQQGTVWLFQGGPLARRALHRFQPSGDPQWPTSSRSSSVKRARRPSTRGFMVREGSDAAFEQRWAQRKSSLLTLPGFRPRPSKTKASPSIAFCLGQFCDSCGREVEGRNDLGPLGL